MGWMAYIVFFCDFILFEHHLKCGYHFISFVILFQAKRTQKNTCIPGLELRTFFLRSLSGKKNNSIFSHSWEFFCLNTFQTIYSFAIFGREHKQQIIEMDFDLCLRLR